MLGLTGVLIVATAVGCSWPDSSPSASGVYARRHALVIGIDEYQDARFAKLSTAAADASAVAEVLKKRFGFDAAHVALLLNEQATKAQIERHLALLSRPDQVGSDDLVVVYFAGHGEQATGLERCGYLVPSDGRREADGSIAWDSLLAMDVLARASKNIPAEHALFLLDCDYSGLAIERPGPPLVASLGRRARQILTACGHDQRRRDGGANRHSLFTGALLDGLSGRADTNTDRVITFGELFEFLVRRVQADIAAMAAIESFEVADPGEEDLGVTDWDPAELPLMGNFADHAGGCVALFPPGVEPVSMDAHERLHQVQLDQDALLAESERMSDLLLVEALEQQADHLWPRRPETIPWYQVWLDKARAVRSRLPEHEQSLQRVKQEAFLSQVVAGVIVEKESSEILWDEADPNLQMRYRKFSNLVAHLRALDPLIADVEQRLAVASTIEAKTIDEQLDAWNECTEAIGKSALYHGLELEPQMGLVPLGEDPESKLWEFWVWESGTRPERDESTKRWKVTGETGIVLVLLPGGTFTMGAQKDDARALNYDAAAKPNESPVHAVTLAPFFLSKYELTNGQWQRAAGARSDSTRASHPAGLMTSDECLQALERIDLSLPTEAQWEYAARGGTTTTDGALPLAAELADLGDQAASASPDDSDANLLPVGSLRANAFGLHDMLGNAWEWCRDWYASSYGPPILPGDGERSVRDDEALLRVRRGGSFGDASAGTRAAYRSAISPATRVISLGCRPAKSVAQ